MDAEYDGRQILGIDLHRRRSVIVRMSEAGMHDSSGRCLPGHPHPSADLRVLVGRLGQVGEVVIDLVRSQRSLLNRPLEYRSASDTVHWTGIGSWFSPTWKTSLAAAIAASVTCRQRRTR